MDFLKILHVVNITVPLTLVKMVTFMSFFPLMDNKEMG